MTKRCKFLLTLTMVFLFSIILSSFVLAETRSPQRPIAPAGDAISPADFPAVFLPGIDKVGVVPERQYFIAFSNGDMVNNWRRSFVDDVNSYASRYVERFGLRYEWTNANANSAQQLADIESLIAMKPDLLLLSPHESAPLTIVADMCNEMGVALLCLDREIEEEPGQPGDMYIHFQSQDYYEEGVDCGIEAVKALTEKYGKPIGNVVEIAGTLGSSPGSQRSQGVRKVLNEFPDIRIVVMRPGEFDTRIGYEQMQDVLEVYKPGEIDYLVTGNDSIAIGAVQAMKEANRLEFKGMISSIDGDIQALELLSNGWLRSIAECTPYYGMIAFEYAIRYLNGEDIPARLMLPMRNWDLDTPEKKELFEKQYNFIKENEMSFIPVDQMGQDVFHLEELSKYYPAPWWEDEKAANVKPFITEEPIKTPEPLDSWKNR